MASKGGVIRHHSYFLSNPGPERVVPALIRQGVCQIVYGENARKCQLASAEGITYPLAVGGRSEGLLHPPRHAQDVYWDDAQRSRWAKVTLPDWTPFVLTCYLDADTRVFGDLAAGFQLLEDGFELVLAVGEHQGEELWWHVGEKERRETLDALPYTPVGLQGGVLFFRRNPATLRLFQVWRDEWLRYQGEDQAALIRALHRWPTKLALLGKPWNGGAVIAHYYGSARA